MIKGHFYFISDRYFIDFPDSSLMRNKETVGGVLHGRPCYYAFQDSKTGLFWLIPVSSQVEKYKKIYELKVQKYGKCNSIAFGEILGHEKAFLLQNMCPVLPEYISDEYFDSNSVPVSISYEFAKKLESDAKTILALKRKGGKVIFPDVLLIEKKLLELK